MRRVLFLLFFSVVLFNGTFAQEDEKVESVPLPKSLRSGVNVKEGAQERKIKMLVGGYFGFSIGNYSSVELAPHFGFYPCKWLALGVEGTYVFSSYRDSYLLERHKSHILGGGAFIEGYAWEYLVIHASYEYLTYKRALFDTNTNTYYDKRVGTHAVLVGLGYKQKITSRISLYGHILFNLNNDEYSLYSIPIFRAGVNVDL